MSDVQQFPTLELLRELAGEAAFERGRKYFEDGHVASVKKSGAGFKGIVLGSEPYTVRVVARGDSFEHDCSCPVGGEGEFCKHLVAASLAWLQRGKNSVVESPYEKLRAWLKNQDNETLAELLFEQALHDKTLFRQLSLKAVRGSAGKDIAGLRKLFEQAVSYRDFVPYEESRDYAYGILGVIEEFQGAIAGNPQGVVELCEHALLRVKAAIGHVDDSNGELSEVFRRIEEIHHEACKAAKPNPKQLARKLLNLELMSEYSEFNDTLNTYADVLGKDGVAEFTRLAREAWDKLPAKTPQATPPEFPTRDPLGLNRRNAEEREDRHLRYSLTHIMDRIARNRGTLEALVEVFNKDLSDPHSFVKIIHACREHKRFDDALTWARKGAEAFTGERLSMLDGMLAEELRRASKHKEATEIIWRAFTERPGTGAFEQLQTFAKPLNDWDYWRDKAVGHLRKLLAKENDWQDMQTRTLLVEIYLAENNIEAALAEAEQPCRWETLTKLAQTCTKDRPAEALTLYTRLVPEILESTINAYSTPNHRYEQAAELMQAAAHVFKRLNRTNEFTTWLTGIRAKYKQKRNFMKLLDATDWA